VSPLVYADIGDEHTLFLLVSGHEDLRPQHRLRIISRRRKIIHKDTRSFFTQVQAALLLTVIRPALVDYLGCTKYKMMNSLVLGGRFDQLLHPPVFLFLFHSSCFSSSS
jgi:hypothetical protein